MYDLVVVGGGFGGLAAASLASLTGLKTRLLEAHSKLGGCAGWFDRGAFHFDAGATALMGTEADEPFGAFLNTVGLDGFEAARGSSYRVVLPDRSVEIVPDASVFLERLESAFPDLPKRHRTFWNLQERLGSALFRAASHVPRLPLRSPSDLTHNLKALGWAGLAIAPMSLFTTQDVLRLFGLDRSLAFRAFVSMLLQDAAQAGPETVPFSIATACLHAYRAGMSRPRGGMRGLAEGLGRRIRELGGEVSRSTLVDRVTRLGPDRFEVQTRRRERIETRQVVFDLPIDRALTLLESSESDRMLARAERKSRAVWSACTAYVAIDRRAIPDDAPLFHQVLLDYRRPIHDGNNTLISLSPVGDRAYGPPDVRVATLSTHVKPEEWTGLDQSAHQRLKGFYRSRFHEALNRALPGVETALVHEEIGTPRSFQRYVRRRSGAVGGPPASRANSLFRAVGSDILGDGLWLVGDSVFPGQGTMAVALSAIRVIERITGKSWAQIRAETSGSSDRLHRRPQSALGPRLNPS